MGTPEGIATLVGRRWCLVPTGHTFKVLGHSTTGQVWVLDGRTQRALPLALVLQTHGAGLLQEVPPA